MLRWNDLLERMRGNLRSSGSSSAALELRPLPKFPATVTAAPPRAAVPAPQATGDGPAPARPRPGALAVAGLAPGDPKVLVAPRQGLAMRRATVVVDDAVMGEHAPWVAEVLEQVPTFVPARASTP
jgi:hypothetical protein